MKAVLAAVGAYLLFDLWWTKTGHYWEYNVSEDKWYLRRSS